MTRKPNVLSVLVMSLAAAHTAHADAVKDFSTGTKVLVDAGTVVVGAPRTSTSTRQIAKATNTLSFALRAEDLGLKLPIAVNFRGEPLGGGWIKYEIDDVYSTPIDLGHGHYLSRITGRVFMRAVPVRGADSQTYGNTRLAIAGLSYATAYGDWGQYMVPITELDLRGGVPQPALGDFAKAGGTVCSNAKTRTHYPFAISLAGAAKASGAYVELKTPYSSGLRLPPGIVINPGKQSAVVNAFIQPGFVGTVHVTASSGGVVRSLDVPVRDCH